MRATCSRHAKGPTSRPRIPMDCASSGGRSAAAAWTGNATTATPRPAATSPRIVRIWIAACGGRGAKHAAGMPLACRDRQVIETCHKLTGKMDEVLHSQGLEIGAAGLSYKPALDEYGQDQGLTIHRPHRERRGRLPQHQRAKIQFARHQRRLLSIAGQLEELQRDAWMLPAKSADK